MLAPFFPSSWSFSQLKAMSAKYQQSVSEKMALKREVASLEEQLMSKTSKSSHKPDAKELLSQIGSLAKETASEVTARAVNITKPAVEAVSQGVKNAWNTSEVYLRSTAPRVMEIYTAAADQARPAMTQTTKKLQEALKTVGPAAERLREQAGPFVKDLSDKAKPAVEAAGAQAAKIFGELQAAALKEARKVEALEPYATEENARVAVSLMLGLPAFWITLTALGAWPFRRSKIVVPKSVAKESVPLRTPTPEKRTKGRTTATGTIRSPDGEDVLHFA